MTDRMTRRNFGELGALLGLSSLGAAAPASGAAGASRHTLPRDPAAQNQALVRMFGTSGSDPVVWKTRGKAFAVLPDKVAPLFAFRGSESSWWRRDGDDRWARFPSTLSFFEDLETGEFIDRLQSPLNGATVELSPSFIRHKEGEWFTPTGHYYGSMKKVFPDRYPDKPMDLNWILDGDVIRLQEGSNFPPILPQPSLEYATLFADASEVFDPDVETPIGRSSGWNIFSATRPPYKEMGVLPGHTIWHFDAVKVSGFDALDADYLERAGAFAPNFNQSPEQDEGPSFFERILKMRAGRAG